MGVVISIIWSHNRRLTSYGANHGHGPCPAHAAVTPGMVAVANKRDANIRGTVVATGARSRSPT